MYKQGLEKLKFPEIEQNILKFWSESKIFEMSGADLFHQNISNIDASIHGQNYH